MANPEENLQTLLGSDTPLLIDCFATWCAPCQAMPPILKEVKARTGDKLRIIKIDVDKNPALAEQWRVSGVPTLLLFRNGKLQWRHSGVVQARQLLEAISPYLN